MACDVRIDDMILGVGFCVLIGFRNSDFEFQISELGIWKFGVWLLEFGL